jgi:hypothetical protein
MKKTIKNHSLNITDFIYQDITSSYTPYFVDPGRKSLFFTTVCGVDDENIEVRKCSSNDYYHLVDEILCKKLDKLKTEHHIKELESNLPFSKTTPVQKYTIIVNYMFLIVIRLYLSMIVDQ